MKKNGNLLPRKFFWSLFFFALILIFFIVAPILEKNTSEWLMTIEGLIIFCSFLEQGVSFMEENTIFEHLYCSLFQKSSESLNFLNESVLQKVVSVNEKMAIEKNRCQYAPLTIVFFPLVRSF